MKRLLLFGIIIGGILPSCTKENDSMELLQEKAKKVTMKEDNSPDAIPWTTSVYDSCTLEYVNCTGTAIFTNTLNGIRIIGAYIRLEGIGEVTGDHYIGVYKSMIQDNYPIEIKASYMFRFRSDSGNTFSFVQREHAVFNEDGNIKMDLFTSGTTCN